jgi:hypothetical protein
MVIESSASSLKLKKRDCFDLMESNIACIFGVNDDF